MTQVHQLYQLQQLDTEIRQKKQRLSEVLKAQREPGELIAMRRRAETAAADLQKWQTIHTDLNLELSSLNDKAKNSERRLYSGKVTNPKELADLQSEIESLGRRREALEDEILEAMIHIEDAQAEKEAAEDALETLTARWEKEVADLKEEQNELALRLHRLSSKRQEQAQNIDAASLKEYEQLLKKKNGLAVASLRINMCQGCQLTVSANKMKAVDEGKKVYCGGCGRILYSG